MTRTATLRQQHDIILQKAILIQDMVRKLGETQSPGTIMRELVRFDHLLSAHLASEDTFLYPEMAASGNELASRTAKHFMEEMGGLAGAYREFVDEWMDEERIGGDRRAFGAAFNRIVFALSKRIHRENTELYPLADALTDSRTDSREVQVPLRKTA